MPRDSIKHAIGPVPTTKDWRGTIAIFKNLKAAVESMLGQGKSASPKKEKAMTGQDLIDLGLITEDELRKVS